LFSLSLEMVKLYSVALNYFFSSRPSFCPNRQKSQHRKKSCKISKYQKILKISALICLVIFGVSLYKYYINYADDIEDFGIRRQLRNKLCKGNQQDDDSGCPDKAHPPGIIIFHLLGALYFFVAIAIACDDFFVPALEAIGKRWEISDDVAGATLMAGQNESQFSIILNFAISCSDFSLFLQFLRPLSCALILICMNYLAGGSAPELATSFIGTFQGSDVGFGTIVGSAVFNVLFIIAICVLCTPKHFAPLKLTAWPLARDCSYYVVTLIMVAMVFGIITPGIIEGNPNE
jgi:sodium/potassium/calcium exchanger 2